MSHLVTTGLVQGKQDGKARQPKESASEFETTSNCGEYQTYILMAILYSAKPHRRGK